MTWIVSGSLTVSALTVTAPVPAAFPIVMLLNQIAQVGQRLRSSP